MSQQASDAALTGAGVEIHLGEHTLVMRPLSDRDFVELDEWLRSKMMTVATAAARAAPDMSEEILTAALSAATRLTFVSVDGQQMISNISGIARVLKQSCKDCKLSVAELTKLLGDNHEVVTEVGLAHRRLNLPGFAKDEEPADPNGPAAS
jgi:hypothetical protein